MAGRPAPKPEGVLFPLDSKGERSTTSSQKDVFASVFTAIGKAEVATEVRNEKNWRKNYTKYVLKHVKTSLNKPEFAIQSAKAGLETLHSTFEFIRDDKTYKFVEAMNAIKGTFETGFVKGEKPKPEKFEFEVPYKGRTLKGEALVKQVEKWRDYGTIEPSAAEAIIAVARNTKWTDLSDSYFVLLGAGSAMGPFLVLLALGANVIAVDLDRAPIWKRLIETARNSPGTLTFPLKVPQKDIKNDEELYANAGSNLITQAPEINNWLQTVYPDKNLIVGCYVYLDGEAHVRVVLACDAIIKVCIFHFFFCFLFTSLLSFLSFLKRKCFRHFIDRPFFSILFLAAHFLPFSIYFFFPLLLPTKVGHCFQPAIVYWFLYNFFSLL